MAWKRKLLVGINALANRMNLHVLSHGEYENLMSMFLAADSTGPEAPPEAREYLQTDNPHLKDLRTRYRNHPAAAHSHWSEAKVLAGFELHHFRRDSHYVWQGGVIKPETYLLTAYHLREYDRLGLLDRLSEDGLFGATTVSFEKGHLLSRDLLDSINEINLMARWFELRADSAFSVLDIGAGYGRLAHRLVCSLERAAIVCVDAVPLSTFLCEYYAGFRKITPRATVVPLDRASEALQGREFDLVTNIHSFSECPTAAIEWWLQCLETVKTRNLLIVPNDGDKLLSIEIDGTRRDFEPLLEKYGWRPARQEPIYSSDVARKFALFPTGSFRLFSR